MGASTTQLESEPVATDRPYVPPRGATASPPPRMPWRRLIVSIVIGVPVVVGGFGAFIALASMRKPAPKQTPPPSRLRVEVFRAEQTNLREMIAGFGTARPDREVVLAAQVAGAVRVSEDLEVGWNVRHPEAITNADGESQRLPGTTLLTIDPETYQERLVQSQSRVSEARSELATLDQESANLKAVREKLQADVDDYKVEFERLEELRERGVSTESEWRKARLQLRTYETLLLRNTNDLDLIPVRRNQVLQGLESADAERKLAAIELERTVVRPPFSATVAEVLVETGQYVRPGDPLVKLVDERHIEIPVSVSLSDFARLAPLLKDHPEAALATDETSPPQWFGRVVRAAPVADQSTRTIDLFVEVDNDEQSSPLRPGTFVQARIQGPVLEQVIAVPRLGIRRGNVYVLPEDALDDSVSDATTIRPTAQAVEIRRLLQNLAIIESGVQRGDLVILTNLDIIPEVAAHPERNFVIDVDSTRSLNDEIGEQVSAKLEIVP